MNEDAFARLLRAAQALAVASPALLAVGACGSESDSPRPEIGLPERSGDGGGGGEAASTPAGASSGQDVADASASCSLAKLPPAAECIRHAQLPCPYDPDAGSPDAPRCAAMCPRDDMAARQCVVARDDADVAYLTCKYCDQAPIGRRPAGLELPAPARGLRLGAAFADAAHLEAASVEAFRALAAELGAHGAPADLLERAERAAVDEVRHADVTTELARRFGAEPGGWSAPPRVARAPRRSLEALALENAVEGQVRETFGALVGLWQAAHARDPEVRAALASIAEDEARHGALSWSIAEWARTQLDEAACARVDGAMREALATLASELAREPDEELVLQAGLPRAAEALRLVDALDLLLWNAPAGASHRPGPAPANPVG
jgi:hypothetical protein